MLLLRLDLTQLLLCDGALRFAERIKLLLLSQLNLQLVELLLKVLGGNVGWWDGVGCVGVERGVG